MAENLYTIGEVADTLGVKFYRIKYAHQSGLVNEPSRIGNRRLYNDDDVRRLREYFCWKEATGETDEHIIYHKPGMENDESK